MKQEEAEKIHLGKFIVEHLIIAVIVFIFSYGTVMTSEILIKDKFDWQFCAPYGFFGGFVIAAFTKVRYLPAMMVAILATLIVVVNIHLDQPYIAVTALGLAFGAQPVLYYKLLQFYRMKVTLMRSKEFWKNYKKNDPQNRP